VERLKGYIPEGIPALPVFVHELLETLQEEFFTARDLEKIISQDAAISARILKVANSALFGFSGTVGTLSHAIVLLGTKFIQALAVSLPMIDLSMYRQAGGRIPWERYWGHSFACGTACSRLTQTGVGSCVREDAFIFGLLHDIGKPILWSHRTEDYHSVMDRVHEGDCDLLQAERTVLGIDHAELGGDLSLLWNLPEQTSIAIGGHHDEPAEDDGSVMVKLADHLAHVAGFGDGIRVGEVPFPPEARELKGFSLRIFSRVLKELVEQSSEICEVADTVYRACASRPSSS
jgi:HD-like signal output (HDOD) protein